jgi:hypothetical protein
MKNWFKREKVKARSFDEIMGEKTEEKEEICTNSEEIVKGEEIKCTALDCFGMSEDKSDNALIKCANMWYLIASFLWFIVGCLTFAPVIFLQSKVNVIFKNKKKSLMCAILTHFCVIALIVILIIMR